MSSKEKVLAIRPGAVCEEKLINRFSNEWTVFEIYCWEIKLDNITIGHSYLSELEAWAAAYKYLTK
jgi:hypothetical protein